MRENRTCGSEGGEAKAFPTPIRASCSWPWIASSAAPPRDDGWDNGRSSNSSSPAAHDWRHRGTCPHPSSRGGCKVDDASADVTKCQAVRALASDNRRKKISPMVQSRALAALANAWVSTLVLLPLRGVVRLTQRDGEGKAVHETRPENSFKFSRRALLWADAVSL